MQAALFFTKRNMKSPYANVKRYDDECYFRNAAKDSREKFPSLLTDPAAVDLSVIIPAYNEKHRRK